MDLMFFIRGLLLGLCIAAPVGPVAILCMKRSLEYGRWSGLFSGLGAAAADTTYGLIAALGLSVVFDWLTAAQSSLSLIGGACLMFMGCKTYLSKPMDADALLKPAKHKNLVKDFFSAFALTLSNPMTFLSFVAIFASFGLVDAQTPNLHKAWLLSGVFIGASFWWLLLAEGVTSFRHLVNRSLMKWLNRFAGCLLIAFGALAWLNFLLSTTPA